MKALAPYLVASTAVSMVPWPLIMMTGIVSRPAPPHSFSSVTPSTSGIQNLAGCGAHRFAAGLTRRSGVMSSTSSFVPA